MDAPGIPCMICMCHGNDGNEGKGESVYNGSVPEREWTREWIGENSLGAADGHMTATWLMGVIVRVE
jgi:hypothetical protein